MPDKMSDTRPSAPGEEGRVRRAVARAFIQAAAAQDRVLQPLADDLALVDSGLDSLCFALVAAQLETELGIDPFADLDDALFPVSFGAFVQLYEAAAAMRTRRSRARSATRGSRMMVR